jgi:hypothetical protein
MSAKVFRRRGSPINAKKQPWLGHFRNGYTPVITIPAAVITIPAAHCLGIWLFCVAQKLLIITFSNHDIITATARGGGVGRIPAMFDQ